METKDKLPPIPTPASQRWREFRIQVLPFVMFIAVIIAIVVLWRSYVQPIGVIGFAETNQVNVTTLSDGLIETLLVESFQVVTQGQLIAVVNNVAPDLAKAQNESAKADLEVKREEITVDTDRVAQNIFDAEQRLQNDIRAQAADRQEWILRSNRVQRAKKEYDTKIISDADYETITSQYAILSISIESRQTAIDLQTKSLEAARQNAKKTTGTSIDAAQAAKEHELVEILKPNYLKSPIDGMISVVHHRKGERILRGESVVTIVDPVARRVIGYVRQPVSTLPTTNDLVHIVKRTAPSTTTPGRIERVGAQFEFINPALLSSDTKRMEVGLPILVSVPPGFPLVPGEYVTLTIEYARQ